MLATLVLGQFRPDGALWSVAGLLSVSVLLLTTVLILWDAFVDWRRERLES